MSVFSVVIQNSSVSGRTQKQLVEYVRENGAKRTPYQRCVFPYTMCTLFIVCLHYSPEELSGEMFHCIKHCIHDNNLAIK